MTNPFLDNDNSLLTSLLISINKKLILIPLSLMLIGIFAIFSLMSPKSDLSLMKHLFHCSISLLIFFMIIIPKKNQLKTILNFSLFFFLLLLIYTHFNGDSANNSKRWMTVFGFSIQPSEFLKGPFICFISWFFYLSLKNHNYKFLFIPILFFLLIILLIAKQPDLSTSMFFFISFSLLFILYIRNVKLISILAFFCFSYLGIMFVLKPHVKARFIGFVNNTSSQVKDSIDAIINGGFFGMGLGEGQLKYEIKENHNDFIYSVIIEEVGILFGILIIFLYPLYLYLVIKASNSIDNLFLKNTVFTLAFMTCFQAFINISTSIGLFIPTGMPLPFVSDGGSSLLSYAIIFGTVVNFTKYEKSPLN